MTTEGESIKKNTRTFNRDRHESVAAFGAFDEHREAARTIKEDAIERLPELLETLEESIEANGGHLHVADDAEEAATYVAEVADAQDAETVVKSKSMTTEEIALNEHLAADDRDVYETDLGEFVIQVAEEAPSHLVGPSLHKSRNEIATLFNEQFDLDEPLETAEELTKFARDYLGEHIKEADIGVTGANFVLAESGTLVLITNEGNARKCAVTPNTHVAVAGIEKVIPSLKELHPFVEVIGRAATGQDIVQYLSLLTPPTDSPTLDFDGSGKLGTDDADRSFHLVLVDNGRTEMREDDDLKETLYCIRCGACANSCSNFQAVGGHAFGGETYTGGIGTGWEAGISGLDAAAEFNDLCTGCSSCVDACPVGIDIPWINTVVRDRINQGAEQGRFDPLVDALTPDAERSGLDLQKRFFGNFETLARLGSATAPVSNWLAGTRPARILMERTLGVDSRRPLPTFKRKTLRNWFQERDPQVETPEREVVLYPDAYTNYVHVERGKAAVRVLEALDVAVKIPEVGASGRAPLSQGMVSTARQSAERVFDDLQPHLEEQTDIVVVEPSDIAMFRREYERLVPEEDSDTLAERSFDILEYVYGLLSNGANIDELSTASEDSYLAYHGHCQQRTLGLAVYTKAALEEAGYDVLSSEAECCGMAGSFGYKSQYYELSLEAGEPVRDQFEGENRRVVASGTSCLEQLPTLLGEPATHPVQILDPAEK
jgi:iron-sulfur cluster protein